MATDDLPKDEPLHGDVHPTDDALQYSSNTSGGAADDLSTADLEEAYLKALESMESAEWGIVPDLDDEPSEGDSDQDSESAQVAATETSGNSSGTDIAGADFLSGAAPVAPIREQVSESSGQTDAAGQAAQPPTGRETKSAPPYAKPLRVIEACLFVGGQPLSAKKLAGMLDGNNDPSVIEVLIDDLNLEYAAQGRPYEIRLGDGGYRLSLRAEFEAVRSRVFGVGPRDVKLSQDVLEVLALVAYQQPITQAAVDACKPNSANLLRQLLRRELISLTRIDQSRNGVEYRTTPRFLQLFGLGQLAELPHPEDLSMR